MPQPAIDGWHLRYPGTGLATLAAELLHAFHRANLDHHIAVAIDNSTELSAFDLDSLNFKWLPINHSSNYPPRLHLLGRLLTIPDHIERVVWSNAVAKKLRHCQLFIPYFHNYLHLAANSVLVPDLLYRLSSDALPKTEIRELSKLRYKLPLRRFFEQWQEKRVKKAKRLFVYSKFVARQSYKHLKIDQENITRLQLGKPMWITRCYDPVKKEVVKKEFGLPQRFALYVGGYGPRKNVPTVISAAKKAFETDPTFRCVFVGLTEQVLESSLNAEIRRMLDRQDHPAIVRLPNLPYEKLASLYRLAEFSVYPSFSEGLGLPILESAAAGVICLCGNNSAMVEVQPNPKYRIDSYCVTSWIEQMLRLWKSPTELRSFRLADVHRDDHLWKHAVRLLWKDLMPTKQDA